MERNEKLILGTIAGAAAIGGLAYLNNRRNHFDLKNKTALIMGGSRGLGLVLARELVTRGANVAICARDRNELDRAEADLRSLAGTVLSLVCDVRDRSEIEKTVQEVRTRFNAIDILINNAGIIRVGPLELQTDEDFEESMQVHFWAPYFAMRAVIPEMTSRGSGRIVNIASFGGKVAVPHLASYCAGKFALVGLSSAIRPEVARHGIRVTTVCPGLMRTGSHVNAEFKGQNEKEYALFSFMDALPLTSISAERAARQVIDAMRRGDAELTITPQAKLAVKFNALFPEATAMALEMVNRFLPGPDGADTTAYTGLESTSAFSPSIVTSLIDRAAENNNELKPNETIN